MRALETAVIYLLLGVAISVGALLRERKRKEGVRWWLVAALVPFWPLLLPLLGGGEERPEAAQAPDSGRIQTAEQRLAAVLNSLDSAAGDAVAAETSRIRMFMRGLGAMEKKIADMDALLATPEFNRATAERTIADLRSRGVSEADARLASARGRLRNIDRLQAMRTRAAEDLERVLLQLDELCAQLQLLKFAGSAAGNSETIQAIHEAANSMQELTDAILADEPVVGTGETV